MTPAPTRPDEHVREPDPRDDTVMYRVVLPVLIPLLAVLTILFIAGSLSRILLASDKAVATTVALAAAVGVMIVASLVVVRPIRTRELATLMTVSALALVSGGVYAATQGYAPLHGEEAGGEHGTAPGDTGSPAARGGSLEVIAIDIGFGQTEMTTSPGEVAVRYVNEGEIPHTLVIEGVSGFKLSVAQAGDVDTGSVTLDAGTYTFFCDVPGHREVGMVGTLTVS